MKLSVLPTLNYVIICILYLKVQVSDNELLQLIRIHKKNL